MRALVPIKDWTEDRNKITTALAIGRHRGIEVYFLGIVDTTGIRGTAISTIPVGLRRELHKRVKETLEKIRREADGEGINYQIDITEGDPKVELLEYLQESDFAVLNTHGMKKGSLSLMAESVIGTARKPLLLVEDPQEEFKKVLVALDGSGVSEKSLKTIKKYRGAFDFQKIGLIHVEAPGEEEDSEQIFNKSMEILMDLKDLTVERKSIEVKNKKEIAEKLVAYAEKMDYDIIALGTKRKSTITRFLVGSVSLNVAILSRKPVVIFP